MNQENRIPAAAVDPGNAHAAECGDFLTEVAPVSPAKIKAFCLALAAEADLVRQRAYWNLLRQSAPSSNALDLALQSIMNPNAPNRGEAVRYLRSCFPDRLPALLEAFARDPDEEMRYQLSEFLCDSDIEAAVGMKIGMLGNASREMQAVLIRQIGELGNLWHLEGLNGLDNLSGGNSVYARAAQLLAKRTGKQAVGQLQKVSRDNGF
jgi:hypothetical protein